MLYEFSEKDLNHYLYLVAKKYQKESKSTPGTIYIVGGAAIVLNYSFREGTTDIDSIFHMPSFFKEIIHETANEEGLDYNWLNNDFTKTDSFSNKIVTCATFYKTFCHCLNVYIVEDEYLIAMKLRARRGYRNDDSDIIGIIKENLEKNTPLDILKIEDAYKFLYNEELTNENREFLEDIFKSKDLEELYYDTLEKEKRNKDFLTSLNTDEKIKIKTQEDAAELLKTVNNINDELER